MEIELDIYRLINLVTIYKIKATNLSLNVDQTLIYSITYKNLTIAPKIKQIE